MTPRYSTLSISVFIARGDLKSNAQNRHTFHHLPLWWLDLSQAIYWMTHLESQWMA